MAFSFSRFFRSDESGAISSMYAIAILPLVVMAGVAFDYGRMMGLDTELQNAADQAALAAATQLDGSENARANAITAASNALSNQTRFASDGLGRGIAIVGDPTDPDAEDDGFEFFIGYENDAPLAEATTDASAKVVQVTIANRAVRYALTPVMAAFSGDVASGRAMATLQEATCNVPPLMFCQPNDPGTGDVDSSFPNADDVGKGLVLHFKSQNLNDCPPGSNSPACQSVGANPVDEATWAPGNFGFLDIDYGITGANQNRTTGLNSDFLGCVGEPPASEPGFRTPQGSALNSRFDFFPPPRSNCDTASGDFCPSTNTRKNLVAELPGAGACPSGLSGNAQGGQTYDFIDPPTAAMDPGYPKDACFLSGSCNVVGSSNNSWDAQAFLTKNHPGTLVSAIPDLDSNGQITRYEVYKWEQASPSTRLASKNMGTIGNKKYCSIPHPINARPGVAPTDDQKDRRVLTVAAVDCSRTADNPDSPLTGRDQPYIVKWVDLFLVQAVNTTGAERFFFAEVKGPARLAGDGSAFQSFSRRKAVLLR